MADYPHWSIFAKRRKKIHRPKITVVGRQVDSNSPIKTEKKNCVIGTSKIGEDMLRNQLGDMGNNLKNNKKKNRLSRFSFT